jgi:hypothetical protein
VLFRPRLTEGIDGRFNRHRLTDLAEWLDLSGVDTLSTPRDLVQERRFVARSGYEIKRMCCSRERNVKRPALFGDTAERLWLHRVQQVVVSLVRW